ESPRSDSLSPTEIYPRRRARKRAAKQAAPSASLQQASPASLDGQDVDGAGRAKPDDVRLAHLGIGHLTILGPRVPGEMPDDFTDVGDARGAQRMALAEQAARDVDWRIAAEVGMLATAAIDEFAGLAVAAQAEVLVVHELGGGKAVVQLGEIHVLGAQARHLVRLLGGAPGQRAHIGQR